MTDDFKSYANDDIEVRFYKSRCTHAATCVKRLRAVFNVRERPWINVNNASVEDIIDAVNSCPSQALQYTLKHKDDND